MNNYGEPANPMSTNGQLVFLESLPVLIARSVNGIQLPADDRSAIAGILFDIAHEHHVAVSILMKNRVYGSAAALMRSIFEAFVRGVWFAKCAKDTDIDRFKKDKFDKKFDELISDISKINLDAHSGLVPLKQKTWAAFNSYTHAGFRPIARRFSGSEILACYTPQELEGIARFTNAFAILALFELAELSRNEQLIVCAEEFAREFKKRVV